MSHDHNCVGVCMGWDKKLFLEWWQRSLTFNISDKQSARLLFAKLLKSKFDEHFSSICFPLSAFFLSHNKPKSDSLSEWLLTKNKLCGTLQWWESSRGFFYADRSTALRRPGQRVMSYGTMLTYKLTNSKARLGLSRGPRIRVPPQKVDHIRRSDNEVFRSFKFNLQMARGGRTGQDVWIRAEIGCFVAIRDDDEQMLMLRWIFVTANRAWEREMENMIMNY